MNFPCIFQFHMLHVLISVVVAQNCDSRQFNVQSLSEWSSVFPTFAPLDASFYSKFINMDGYPVASSSKTTDAALQETAKWICIMFTLANPSIKQSMIGYKGKMTVMARYPQEKTSNVPEHSFLTPHSFWDERARGLGGTTFVPTTSCAEENIMCDPDDRYRGECIAIHEFAHSMALQSGNQTFLNQLESTFQNTLDKKLWQNTYALTNSQEYWAEGVQSWFDCNTHRDVTDGQHGPISNRNALKTYDPELATLLAQFFGDGPIRYQCPSTNGPIVTNPSTTSGTVSATGTVPPRVPDVISTDRPIGSNNEPVVGSTGTDRTSSALAMYPEWLFLMLML